MGKDRVIEQDVEIKYCPFANCVGYITLGIVSEDEQEIIWEGECVECRETFNLKYVKHYEDD